jgi:hypothetical protein
MRCKRITEFAGILRTSLRQRLLVSESESRDRSPAGASDSWVEAYLGPPGRNLIHQQSSRLPTAHSRGVGRDYVDVPPTRGEAESERRVLVTVSLVDAAKPEDLGSAMVFR